MTPDCVNFLPLSSSSTGTSPIALTSSRQPALRVAPPAKSANVIGTGCQGRPSARSRNATLNVLPDWAKPCSFSISVALEARLLLGSERLVGAREVLRQHADRLRLRL